MSPRSFCTITQPAHSRQPSRVNHTCFVCVLPAALAQGRPPRSPPNDRGAQHSPVITAHVCLQPPISRAEAKLYTQTPNDLELACARAATVNRTITAANHSLIMAR
ncbi:hypothetical protein WMY93_033882 [Mugilogobius chulae]|uniref:Uncharacterized protein n=1 Tax=Mugilogobius chulae TaxID=88201 RepID=A0AAW0MGT4_9GOBI